jgi:hypothetical protein
MWTSPATWPSQSQSLNELCCAWCGWNMFLGQMPPVCRAHVYCYVAPHACLQFTGVHRMGSSSLCTLWKKSLRVENTYMWKSVWGQHEYSSACA